MSFPSYETDHGRTAGPERAEGRGESGQSSAAGAEEAGRWAGAVGWAGGALRSTATPSDRLQYLNKLETFFYFVTLNEFSVKANKYQNQYKNSHLKKNSVRDARTVDRLA